MYPDPMYSKMMYPHVTQFEENRIELEREARLRRELREAREAARSRRPSRWTRLTAAVRGTPRPAPCPPLVSQA
jgi:hypothetical protein